MFGGEGSIKPPESPFGTDTGHSPHGKPLLVVSLRADFSACLF